MSQPTTERPAMTRQAYSVLEDLARLVRIEAGHFNVSPSKVIDTRLRESFERYPDPMEPPASRPRRSIVNPTN